MSWRPPTGSRELPDEPGVYEAPNGSVYVHPDTWESWQPTDADRKRWDFERQRFLEHVRGPRPSLEQLEMWNRNLHALNEELADAVAEFVGLVPGARWFFAARGLDV